MTVVICFVRIGERKRFITKLAESARLYESLSLFALMTNPDNVPEFDKKS
jgi:hypothetical protein